MLVLKDIDINKTLIKAEMIMRINKDSIKAAL